MGYRRIQRHAIPNELNDPMEKSNHAPLDERIQEAVNNQIQAELQSAYLYLAMSAKFEHMSLGGFAHWLRMQWQEETAHAMKFYDFLLQRDGEVVLQALEQPVANFSTPLQAFELVLAHEQHITKLINDLYVVASELKDFPLQNLLRWFIDEQVEEEESARSVLDSLKLIGDSGPNLFLLDRELASRASA